MNIFGLTLSEQFVRALGWTLIHSLWQGALVALLLAIAMIYLRKYHAKVRYAAYFISLMVIFSLSVITFTVIYRHSSHAGNIVSGQTAISNPITTGMIMLITEGTKDIVSGTAKKFSQAAGHALEYINVHLPVFILIWLTGVFFFMTRFIGGLFYVNRLKRHRIREVDENWQDLLNHLSEKLSMHRRIRMLESAIVKVPMVVGFLKPVVLLPAGLISGLPMQQLEMILVHELVHIQRRDYLVNLFQSIMEVIFFYHPAVWWISHNIRLEREHVCDDMTLAVSGDSITYARALASLREIELRAPALASAITRNKHQLLNRIQRIIGKTGFKPVPSGGLVPATVIIIAILTFASVMAISYRTDANAIMASKLSRNDGIAPDVALFTGLLPDNTPGLPDRKDLNFRVHSSENVGMHLNSPDLTSTGPDTLSQGQPDTSLVQHNKAVYDEMQSLSRAMQQLGEELRSMQEDFMRLQNQIHQDHPEALNGQQREAMQQYRKLIEEQRKEIREQFRDDSLQRRKERIYLNLPDSCGPDIYIYGMPDHDFPQPPGFGEGFQAPGNHYYYYKRDTTFTDSLGSGAYENFWRYYSNCDSLVIDTSLPHAFRQWKWNGTLPEGHFMNPCELDSLNAELRELYIQMPGLLDDKDLNDLLENPPEGYDFRYDSHPEWYSDKGNRFYFQGPEDKESFEGRGRIDNYSDFYKVKQIMREELLDDGLITPGKNYIIEINAKEMVINGVKQPKSVYTKYRRLMESAIGEDLKEGVTYYF